jgi:predicted permease
MAKNNDRTSVVFIILFAFIFMVLAFFYLLCSKRLNKRMEKINAKPKIYHACFADPNSTLAKERCTQRMFFRRKV